MQFLCEFFTTSVKKIGKKKKCVGGSHIQHKSKQVFSCDFQITLKNRNMDGGGGECNFSLTILKENCFLLQLPIDFSHTIDARIEKHGCIIP